MNKLCKILLLLTAVFFIFTAVSFSCCLKIPVTFVNEKYNHTCLGIAKFILDKDGEPIDYILLNERWCEHTKVLELEPGLYGVTQYDPHRDLVINYQQFWVYKHYISNSSEMIVRFY